MVSLWSSTGKFLQSWLAHASSDVTSVRISNQNLVLSGGSDDVCVYSQEEKTAQLTCWNETAVTASEWINKHTFAIGENSGKITIDRVYPKDFRKVIMHIFVL